MESRDMIVYTLNTPDCNKVSITLEELGLKYQVRKVNVSKGEQKEPWFTEINPNGRIPALVDQLPDGSTIKLFESGSIMQYLTDRYDQEHRISFPRGTPEYYETGNWLFFQNAGVGPIQGQAVHFLRYNPVKMEYSTSRYITETRRLYRVLDKHLATRDYLVGGKCTIADIAHWGWITAAFWAGVDLSQFPNLARWEKRMRARPGVQRGKEIPDRHWIDVVTESPEMIQMVERENAKWIQAAQVQNAQL
ncbi:hypothetical protein AYO20_01057 [Fonsecaea nubica]|uniref:Glutathione S-transferase n=1 Tax=Fonsecaea nubica TaxID=856822 RepID=A0A178DBM6_9EURO|nr:hypothetical protein AYO20_01057 [Fonsecaea nubica]OAL39660.1 hypothetical protein AYO20_01057 [Fonsecaea nubica]